MAAFLFGDLIYIGLGLFLLAGETARFPLRSCS
jgi:hypothetical protein